MKKEALKRANEIVRKLDDLTQKKRLISEEVTLSVSMKSVNEPNDKNGLYLTDKSVNWEAELFGEFKRRLESQLKHQISILEKEFAEL